MKKSILVVIDGQNDFMDVPGAALPVTGAAQDMNRVALMIDQMGHQLWDIQLTFDSHHAYHIAHPLFWVNGQGQSPAPFTEITLQQVNSGQWRARMPNHQKLATEYVRALDANARYNLVIWNPHCLIGSWGHNLYQPLFEAVSDWEKRHVAIASKVTKGSNWSTEHYSAVRADVERPDDPGTQLNIGFIETLQEADHIFLTGQASSHCVANTVTDIADNFGTEPLNKLFLVEDGMSPVPGFEALSQNFFRDMKARGVNICSTQEVMSTLKAA